MPTTTGTTASIDFISSTTTTDGATLWFDRYNNAWFEGPVFNTVRVKPPPADPDGDALERLRGMRERRGRGLEVAV